MTDEHNPLTDPIEDLFKDNPDVKVTRLGSLSDIKALFAPEPAEPLKWHDEPMLHPLKGEPYDPGCGRFASEIPSYVDTAAEYKLTIPEYIKREEGTYNHETNHFLCDACYIAAGMPTASGRGWKCP